MNCLCASWPGDDCCPGAADIDGLYSRDVVGDAGCLFLLGGDAATFTAVPDNITDPLETLPVYTNVFGKIGLVTLGVAVVMLLMVPWLKRMIATPESH